MTKKIVKRTDANNETLYFYTHSDAVDVGEGSSTKSLTEVLNDTLHKSAQTLTNAEKTQALTNLGLNGVDDVPTENSNNVVRSGGVKAAIDDVIDDFTNRGFMYKGIAPASAPLGEDKTFYIAKSGDYSAYTGIGNDGSFTLNGIAVLTYATTTASGAWTKNDIVLFDEEPTAGSNNLVKSGGVKNELALGAVYDVSAKNPTAGHNNDGKWESLSALLSDANLNTLIPTAVRKGGMSIKFVQSSDNKYVSFRYTLPYENTTAGNTAFVNVANWQGVDDEPTAGSNNLIKSGGVEKYLAHKNITVNNPSATTGRMTLGGTIDTTATGYRCVAPIELKDGETILLNKGNAFYHQRNTVILYLCDSQGVFISSIIEQGNSVTSKKESYRNDTGQTIYVGTCTERTTTSYIITGLDDALSKTDYDNTAVKVIEQSFSDAKKKQVLNNLSIGETPEFDAKIFRLLKTDFGVENVADFSTYDSSDVLRNTVGSSTYAVTFSNNVITASKSANANGSFILDLTKLGLAYSENYLIAIERRGQKGSVSNGIDIYANVTEQSAGSRINVFSVSESGCYQYVNYLSLDNRFIMFSQNNNENEINYVVYIYKITDLQKIVSLVHDNSSIIPYHNMLFEVGLGMDANAADFSEYSSSDVIYNTGNLTISFDKNKIISKELGSVGNKYVGISLDDLSLEDGIQYTIRLYKSASIPTSNFSINTGTTSSSVGTVVANFTESEDGSYITATFTAVSGLCLVWLQPYAVLNVEMVLYICRGYEVPSTDVSEVKGRENYANRMSWELLKGTTSGVNSATKMENGVTIDMTTGANKIAVFLLPQLKEGHSYTLKIECSSLINQQTVRNTFTSSAVYTFSANSGIYTLNIQNYKEYYYPLYLALQLKYNVATHNVLFYITDDAEPLEKNVVVNSALTGIDENNISYEMLKRCDYLQDIPTLYKGMDIVAFNKGICIGDSTTAGSLNTTDSQGSSGSNVPADPTKAYPAKLSKLTGIELTNAGDGGKTSYGYWNAHQNDDWSGYEFAIILLGINDVSSTGHGEWDSDSVTAFTNIINKLKTENKGIKVFVSTILNTQSYKGLGGGVNEGITQLVEDLNDPDVILLDIHKYGRLNLTNAYSCGHPSQYGYYRLAQDYCNYISWYMATHKQEFRFIQFIGTDYVYTKDY